MNNLTIDKEIYEIDEELFAPLSSEEKKAEIVVRPSIGYWANAWRRLKHSRQR